MLQAENWRLRCGYWLFIAGGYSGGRRLWARGAWNRVDYVIFGWKGGFCHVHRSLEGKRFLDLLILDSVDCRPSMTDAIRDVMQCVKARLLAESQRYGMM